MKKIKKAMPLFLAVFAFCLMFGVSTKAEAARVTFNRFNDTSITISWEKYNPGPYETFLGYIIKDANKKTICQITDINVTTATITCPKGYSNRWTVYAVTISSSGDRYENIRGYINVNTTPNSISSKNFGITSVLSYTKKVQVGANVPAGATGVEVECYQGSKRVWKDTISSSTYPYTYYQKYSTNKVYKYRARAYYKNYSTNRTYYGAPTGWKYFTVPYAKMKSKSSAKGVSVTLKRTPGVKYYKVYISKKQNSGYKRVKTVKVTKKSKYSFRITKNYKKRKTNYIRVVPYITVGNKLVKSDIYSQGSIYIFK